MATKTENLAIMMTDIVDFTKITVHQSRSENEQLLTTHNDILLPILRYYGGRHVKSIGDALLTVFKSPTDAMLCAMAMQDALYEYNQNEQNQAIHIRIGASLGEVRVTRNDIFGEPVNLTSRVEGVTPADEIYLTEALYMAMNKAEVPAKEVGFKDIRGLKEPVRLYSIPRFSESRLVPQQDISTEDLEGISFPYGGAHLSYSDQLKKSKFKIPDSLTHLKTDYVAKAFWVIPILILVSIVFWLGKNSGIGDQTNEGIVELGKTTQARQPPVETRLIPENVSNIDFNSSENSLSEGQSVADKPRQDIVAVAGSGKQSIVPDSAPIELHGPPVPAAIAALTKAKPDVKQVVVAKKVSKPKTVWNVRKAKSAYRERRISKARYRDIIYDLKVALKKNIVAEKKKYRARKITKTEYKKRVRKLEVDYRG